MSFVSISVRRCCAGVFALAVHAHPARHGAVKTLEWKIAPEKVDYHHYLPVFIEGPPPAAVDDVLIQPSVRSFFLMEIIHLIIMNSTNI